MTKMLMESKTPQILCIDVIVNEDNDNQLTCKFILCLILFLNIPCL